jgi:hypothetical protein
MISCGDGPAKKGVSCAAALNHYEGVVLLEHTCEGEPRDLTRLLPPYRAGGKVT